MQRIVATAFSHLASLKERSDFGGFNFRGAVLNDARLYNANLSEANLSYANLEVANLSEANLTNANLFNANLSWANLKGANLTKADLYKADLSRADLRGAKLSGAYLREANLLCANLSGVDLSEAHLMGVNFEGADLTGAILPLSAVPSVLNSKIGIWHPDGELAQKYLETLRNYIREPSSEPGKKTAEILLLSVIKTPSPAENSTLQNFLKTGKISNTDDKSDLFQPEPCGNLPSQLKRIEDNEILFFEGNDLNLKEETSLTKIHRLFKRYILLPSLLQTSFASNIKFPEIMDIISSYFLSEGTCYCLSIFFELKKIKSILKSLKLTALERDQNNLLVYGPLPLKKATKDFEFLVKSLLNKNLIIYFGQIEQELYSTIQHNQGLRIINITEMLAAEPDVEHIQLSENDLETFTTYLISKERNLKPLKYNFTQEEIKYHVNSQTLHLGEKLAINIYTGNDFYELVNTFFRRDGRYIIEPRVKAKYPSTYILYKDIFLIGTVITLALSKLPCTEKSTNAIRFAKIDSTSSRIEALKSNSIFYEKSFFSTHNYHTNMSDLQFRIETPYIYFILKNFQGKCIQAYSQLPPENEILFGIGTLFIPLAYRDASGKQIFIYTPTRALKIMQEKTQTIISASIPQTLFLSSKVITRKVEEEDHLSVKDDKSC